MPAGFAGDVRGFFAVLVEGDFVGFGFGDPVGKEDGAGVAVDAGGVVHADLDAGGDMGDDFVFCIGGVNEFEDGGGVFVDAGGTEWPRALRSAGSASAFNPKAAPAARRANVVG